jgi:hypothetical protein
MFIVNGFIDAITLLFMFIIYFAIGYLFKVLLLTMV